MTEFYLGQHVWNKIGNCCGVIRFALPGSLLKVAWCAPEDESRLSIARHWLSVDFPEGWVCPGTAGHAWLADISLEEPPCPLGCGKEGVHLCAKNPDTLPRVRILIEAMELISHDRNATHGEPEDNFANIAALWNAFLRHRLKEDETLDALDVADLMVLFKYGRIMNNRTNHDSRVDAIGYGGAGGELAELLDDVMDRVGYAAVKAKLKEEKS